MSEQEKEEEKKEAKMELKHVLLIYQSMLVMHVNV